MILDALVYGVVLVWLLGVVPAGVVTCLRGRWLLFFCGWLTAGVLWFVGALVPEEGDTEYQRRLAAIATAGLAAAFIGLGLFGARPVPLLGVNGTALQNSVGGILGPAVPNRCERSGEDWICGRYDDAVSGSVPYRVRVDGAGCWKAARPHGRGGRVPKSFTGCADLADYVFD